MNVLKAHAAAVKGFRKIVPGGQVSMNLNAETSLPWDASSDQDKVQHDNHYMISHSVDYLRLWDCQIGSS